MSIDRSRSDAESPDAGGVLAIARAAEAGGVRTLNLQWGYRLGKVLATPAQAVAIVKGADHFVARGRSAWWDGKTLSVVIQDLDDLPAVRDIAWPGSARVTLTVAKRRCQYAFTSTAAGITTNVSMPDSSVCPSPPDRVRAAWNASARG